ncbi:MAG: S41 family peptidase [Melioribacter sp.]|uniref:S41 family peptidase n=1 Tax=Rosettibacter primus TaxID=3111523 RepID=UPI00247B7C07|nr:S41 family peptidase [Melioribacter sp.]
MNRSKIFFAIAFILIFSGFIRHDSDFYFEINKSIDIFGRVYKEVALNYVDPIDPEEFMLAGISGMLESLDPYTNFIDDSHQKDIDIITKGKYGGIGATVGLRNENVTIVDLIEGYSAQRQGLRIGDIIIKVDDTPVTKENYESLSNLLKGEPGTSVKITIRREGVNEDLTFNLIREEIEIKNLSFYGFIPENSNNVYLKLSGFSRAAGDEVKKALLELKSQRKIESIILDLRGNPGGLLDAAIDVCEKFLPKGQLIVTVKGRDSSNVKKYFSQEEPIASSPRLAVLIDEGSASASEIVAGAVQDHDRAVIVGTNSFGKGLVQTVIPLSFNTSLKITTARYYTPSGRCIQKINYSDKNKVLQKSSTQEQTEFQTDNRRKVLSAGGITPDSIVNNKSKSILIQRLLADGMFFKFATYLYNNNSSMNLNEISDNYLLKEFKNYVEKQSFQFVSPTEKLIEQLKQLAKDENLGEKFIEQLENAKHQIAENNSKEIDKFKDEIISLIKEELAARTIGRIGRILESLKHDNQFETALSILNNPKIYNKFLSANVH